MTLRTVSHPLPELKMITDQPEKLFFSKLSAQQHHLSLLWDGKNTWNVVELGKGRGKWFLAVVFVVIHNTVKNQEKDEFAIMFPRDRERGSLWRTIFKILFYFIFLFLQFFRLTRNEIINKSRRCANKIWVNVQIK